MGWPELSSTASKLKMQIYKPIMKVSAVIVGRNDDYGGRLNERATYCFNTMLDAFDEVIYVDWNSENGRALTEDLEITVNRDRLKVIKVSPTMCEALMGTEKFKMSNKCCQVLAKNIGIRRATGDIIVATNVDIIPPRRDYLDVLINSMEPSDFVTISKHDVDIDKVNDIFNGCASYQKLRDLLPLYYGLNPVSARLMIPYITMTKEAMMTLPPHAHHVASSVIMACGDFQIAHRDMWFKIKGYEESMIKRLYDDSIVQYKAILLGDATIRATNFPPVYHLDHARNNAPELLNEQIPPIGQNPDTWGFSTVDFPFIN